VTKVLTVTAIASATLAAGLGVVLWQTQTRGPEINNASFVSAPIPMQVPGTPAQTAIAEPAVVIVTPTAPVPRPVEISTVAATADSPDSLRNLSLTALGSLNAAPATQPEQPAQLVAQNSGDFRSLTSGVLARLPGSAISGNSPAENLQALVLKALGQGKDSAYIDSLVNQAAFDGDVQIPAGLVTAEGRVDTKTLIASLVGKTSPQPESDYLSLINTVAASSFVDTAQVVQQPQQQFYTVQPGDSLASISLQYFGTTSKYQQIFEANTDTLFSPDRVRAGQRLVIPVL
jgi:nucleoid-associated protein YgaU